MHRTLISGLLASVGLSAATISGSVYDPSGALIPDAKILLLNPETTTKHESLSTSDGKFSFDGLPAGQYILRVEKPGFASLFRELTLDQDATIERGFTLNVGSIQQSVKVQATGAPAKAVTPVSPGRLRIGGSVQESHLLTKVQPVYPASAKAAGVQGTVLLEMAILKDGTPGEITVLSSPGDDLSQAALNAVRQWRYSPTLLNGEPVEVLTDVTVTFTLGP